LAALEDEASQEMEKCLREGKPDEYNRYMATVYKPAMLTNPLRVVEKAEFLKNILVKDEDYIEYLKKCIAEIIRAMVSRKLHGTNTQDKHEKPVEKRQDDLPPNPEIENIKERANLRPWKNGKHKCPKLPAFINVYADEYGHNPPPSLIRDYLVKEDGEAFSPRTITDRLNHYGVATEKKKEELRKKITKK
jgi:hypothetical protein